jgi:hypothetical protein
MEHHHEGTFSERGVAQLDSAVDALDSVVKVLAWAVGLVQRALLGFESLFLARRLLL